MATFIPTGAIIQEFRVGGRNIVLNFLTEAEYLATDNPGHFGATIGRVANRIRGANIDNLDGQAWALTPNDRGNTLHGGPTGWGKRRWDGPKKDAQGRTVFEYTSVHLEEGFPGEVAVKVLYTVRETKEKTVLDIEYEARLVGGAEETVVNMTNHSYFNLNLSSAPTIAGTHATLHTNQYLPINDTGIPIDESTASYPGITANKSFVLGPTDPDVDDCFVFADEDPSCVPIDTRKRPLRACASFFQPDSKVHLKVESTEPAFQFYTAKYVTIPARPDGTPERVPRSAFCVEPSRYVDAVNREKWKGMVVLKSGEVYGSRIVFTAWEE